MRAARRLPALPVLSETRPAGSAVVSVVRSPLSYPGAKRKLLPRLLPLLTAGNPATYSEPFVGGGSVMLAVAEALPDCKLIVNDLHPNIAAFWRVVVDGQDLPVLYEWILSVKPSVEQFRYFKNEPHITDVARAAIALYINRNSHGSASENPRGGWDGKGTAEHDERWFPERDCERIQRCHELLAGRTEVWQANFWEVPWAERVYLDPPYVKEGPGLYALGGWLDEHEMLATHLVGREGWVLSYDEHPYVRELFDWATIREVPVHYTASGAAGGRHVDTHELVITPSPSLARRRHAQAAGSRHGDRATRSRSAMTARFA